MLFLKRIKEINHKLDFCSILIRFDPMLFEYDLKNYCAVCRKNLAIDNQKSLHSYTLKL